jgi:hypothetical protein
MRKELFEQRAAEMRARLQVRRGNNGSSAQPAVASTSIARTSHQN